MSSLPTGAVTFLFTDMAGSTRLARGFADLWPAIQARHLAIMREALAAHQGDIFQVIGDEVDAAFSAPGDALAAAIAALEALEKEDWGAAGPVRVRMGLHTGPATPRDGAPQGGGALQGSAPQSGGYDGYLTLSHTKRLMSTAYGGQVLLSAATAELLRESLPPEVTLRDLGEYGLKDFEHPEHIYQALAPGLGADFPPLKSPGVSNIHLPAQLTSFIGREKELEEVKDLLDQGRVVTLTGPGGSGKTRLALQAAAQSAGGFPDGVCFVALAAVSDPGLVAPTIAQALGIPEAGGRSILDRLKDELRNKSVLLVLDNFEQVIGAAPLLAELLAACPGLKLLVTSRESLRISGERDYPVPPLALPDPQKMLPLASLARYPAVELFLQRARAVRPDFRLSEDTAGAVAEICSRLDGLPLAIELAAARVRMLPPRAILARLGNRLEFLTGGARDLPARQQTLRGAIAWSYDMLDESEQRLFRRLSVFAGGCTLESAAAGAGDPPAPVLDGLASLIDKSLLLQDEAEERFVMLDTLREFGLEQLAESGEGEAIRRRHAAHFLALAEQAETRLGSAGQVEWINQMEREHDNLRAALEWACSPGGDAEMCLRLAGSLGLFWESRGYFSEGRERLAVLLAMPPAQDRTIGRARLLARAAELAYRQSDYPATTALAAESLDIYRQLADRQGMAAALVKLGNSATEVGDYPAASASLEEALSIWRGLADQHGTARALISLGWVALRPGDYPLARARLEEALSISRGLGDTRGIAFELAGLGEVALRQGDYPLAARLAEESLDLRRQLGSKWGIGVSLGILGWVAMRQGDLDRAADHLLESLTLRREIGDQSGSAWCLERLAAVARMRGQLETAAHLFGAASALRAAIRSVIDPSDRPAYDSQVKALRSALGEKLFASAWAAGEALTLDQAAAEAAL